VRYDHFLTLPEKAFQPRNGRYGMTLEGGGGGIIGDIVGGVGDLVGGAVDFVGDVVGGAVDIVRDVGRDIDDFVNEEVPGGWATVGVAAGGAYLYSGAGAATAGAAEAAAAGATAGTGAGLSAGGSAAAGLGGSAGTGLTVGSTGAGFTAAGAGAPGIASMGGGTGLLTAGSAGGIIGATGLTPAGAAPILGSPGSFINDPSVLGQPVINPATSSISLNDAFRAANLAQNLMAGQPQQQQIPNQQLPGTQATGVDLLSLPQFAAGVPNIAGLLNPMPYRGPTFDFYTGLPTSLLG
jgi:hypothetical protein